MLSGENSYLINLCKLNEKRIDGEKANFSHRFKNHLSQNLRSVSILHNED